MAAALQIVRRDLLRYLRNPVRTAMLFAIPLVLATIFAVVFGGGGGSSIQLRVLLWDEDGSLLTRLLERAGDSEQADGRLDVVPVGEEGLAMLDRGEASALLHIPAGFTQALVDGTPTTLELVKNPAERYLPQVVEEGVFLGATGLSEASRLFHDELQSFSGLAGSDAAPADPAIAGLSVAISHKMQAIGPLLFPPLVTLDTATVADHAGDTASGGMSGVLAFFLPGLSVLGVLFFAQSATRDVLRDREAGLTRHLLTAPVTPRDYLLGKCLSVILSATLGLGLLVLAGLAAGVRWGPLPGVIAMIAATAAAAAGLLLLITAVCRTERQADTIGTIVIMVSSMLGGAFVPLSQLPGFLLPAARLTPVYWATDGFTRLMAAGAGSGAAAVDLAVLAGIAVVTLGIAAGRLDRSLSRGLR